MVIIKGPRTVRIRYKGQGDYIVASFTFSPSAREQEVPERLAEFLLDEEPELFTLADRED
ncbi:MAG: hypothetical protein NZ651_06255 [Candidatus Bipolaricaulota bacterium]|nr:hypothetical protein [Candidatus Bipolaricaulota bacterium]MDW8127356.1 hypothetical protein [Candidatus Bipolaricaulota bacterium]